MKMIMSLEQLNSIDDVRGFLEGTQAVIFGVAATKKERYRWVQKALVKHRYMLLNKAGKGLITRYLMKVTSYSHAQIKRLIRQYVNTGKVTLRLARGNGFKLTYTSADVRLLARMDELHGQPSGAVLKKLCERAHDHFNDSAHDWLASIVNSFSLFSTLEDALWGAVAGYMSLWLVYWSYRLVTGKHGMGYGDFKLLAALGAWLGWEHCRSSCLFLLWLES